MKKWLLHIVLVLLILLVVVAGWMYWNIRDRHPGYELDLAIEPGPPAPLQVGFAKSTITPDIIDTWTDVNGDARFDEADGDTYTDANGNGRFDAYWIAGFGNARAANGVHDDLWVRAMILDDGSTRIALVVLDAIGFFHDDVVDVRNLIPESAGIDYAIIASTHVHEAPDLMGLWGPSNFTGGVDLEYLRFVKQQAAQAVTDAAAALRPARLKIAEDPTGASNLVKDSRNPLVLDPGLRMVQALDSEADTTLGTLVAWANHPETLWSKNLLITSDFPHFVREGVEQGVFQGDTLRVPGVGGVAMYINGAIGGLMTTDTRTTIHDPFTDETYLEPSFEKAEAQGNQLALHALVALADTGATYLETGSLAVRAQSFGLPVDNHIFRLAAALGVLKRGFTGWMNVRTEVAALKLGPMSFLCIPGEIYPELVNGGIEAPAGRDYMIDPLEVPDLRSEMPGRYRFVFGLANDEVGYIIPKSEWDTEPPYLYNDDDSPYGEINSLGPETAPLIHTRAMEILQDLNAME